MSRLVCYDGPIDQPSATWAALPLNAPWDGKLAQMLGASCLRPAANRNSPSRRSTVSAATRKHAPRSAGHCSGAHLGPREEPRARPAMDGCAICLRRALGFARAIAQSALAVDHKAYRRLRPPRSRAAWLSCGKIGLRCPPRPCGWQSSAIPPSPGGVIVAQLRGEPAAVYAATAG